MKIERELVDYLLINACNAALYAGVEIAKLYRETEVVDVSLKSDNTVVIEADRVSHELIKKYLSQTRVPMLSEEGRSMLFEERYRWDLYWCVDPIDGTREFIKRNDEFVVCIALMYEGKPLFGVIYPPMKDKLYFSDPDRGAFVIEEAHKKYPETIHINSLFEHATKIKPAEYKEGEALKVAVTRSHGTPETAEFVEWLKGKYGSVEMIECGSSLKFCYLADGTAHLYARFTGVFDWDVAAGHAIATAAGISIKHLDGTDIQYNKKELTIAPFVAGNVGCFP